MTATDPASGPATGPASGPASGPATGPATDPATEGRRRAEELVRLLAADGAAVDALLAGLTDVRDLAFLGAGLTAIARTEGRRLPTAQRTQASTRQLRLGQLRDAQQGDPAGLRTWLRRAGEEILLIRSLQATADRTHRSGG